MKRIIKNVKQEVSKLEIFEEKITNFFEFVYLIQGIYEVQFIMYNLNFIKT